MCSQFQEKQAVEHFNVTSAQKGYMRQELASPLGKEPVVASSNREAFGCGRRFVAALYSHQSQRNVEYLSSGWDGPNTIMDGYVSVTNTQQTLSSISTQNLSCLDSPNMIMQAFGHGVPSPATNTGLEGEYIDMKMLMIYKNYFVL
jgi:hypothetical protein